MAVTTILAPGNTAGTSQDVVLLAGTTVKVGIYSASPSDLLSHAVKFAVMSDTPGADNFVVSLDNNSRTFFLNGPGTYRVVRPEYTGPAFGVFKDV